MIIKLVGKMIGEAFPEKKLFVKRVTLSRHLFKKLDAWGIDADYFEKVLLPNNYTIVVLESEESKTYKTTAEFYKKHGQYFHFKKSNLDHRAQIFLSRSWFTTQ